MKLNIENTASLGHGADFRPTIAYVLDPRFPGGTSGAVARELLAISGQNRPKVYGISSRMFSGQNVAPVLQAALDQTGSELIWDPVKIQADVVILHNPAFLKFNERLNTRILAHKIIVVSHENFTRPGGALGFDVAKCLDLIDRASIAIEKTIAPVSDYNRDTAAKWLGRNPKGRRWQVLEESWFNICDFEFHPPNPAPTDRRGRLSRPGFEKFPSLEAMELCFPETAKSNVILGADTFMNLTEDHPHWSLIPFRGMDINSFFQDIDFMVYFTSNCLRESFGRVLAEAVAAGKVVITDAGTASTIGDGIVTASPKQVNGIIENLTLHPDQYADLVNRAQASLRKFSRDRFLKMFGKQVSRIGDFAK